MVRSGLYPELPERAGFFAVALGGSGDRHPEAMRFLSEMVESYEDPVLREVAAVNLGRIGGAEDLSALATPYFAEPPRTEAEGRIAGGIVTGLYNAATKDRAAAEATVPIYERVLREWDGGPWEDEVRQEALRHLRYLRFPELEGALRALSEDTAFPATAREAQRALTALLNRDED